MTYFLAFVVSFIYIFLKATQQRQVMACEYRRMPAVSLAMGFCEVFIVANVARSADGVAALAFLAVCIGLGSAGGSMLGTYLHARKH